MATTESPTFRYGQRVRITECPQNHPDHQGQVGMIGARTTNQQTIRVYVGTGICQAAAVALVDEPNAVIRGKSAGVFSNHIPPEFRRNRT